jgi:hypothetical protein
VIVGLVDLIIVGSFAFVRINGRPFHYFVLNVVQTMKKPALRVWNSSNPIKDMLMAENIGGGKAGVVTKPAIAKQRLVSSHLKELSLIVDTKGVYKGEDEEKIV